MKKQSLIYPLAAVCMYLTPNLPCYAGEVFRNSVPEKDSIVYTLSRNEKRKVTVHDSLEYQRNEQLREKGEQLCYW